MFSLRNYIDIVEGTLSEQPVANPYTGADAEKFARLSPEDQAWYTKGGGKPDLNDPYIAARAPNKGKLGPAPAPAAAPGAGTAAAAMAAPSTGTAAAPVDDRNEMDKASDAAAAAKPATAQAATPAPAAGAAAGAAAGGAAGAVGAANPATGVNAQGQNVSINNPDGSKTNPETGETTPAQAATPAPAAPAAAAAPANRDAMPFGKAFADARAKGEKEFTWKGKKYAVTMAKPAAKPAQAATPAPAKPLPGKAAPAGGAANTMDSSVDAMGNPTGQYGVMAENIQMNEFDMDMDRIMKNMGNVNKTSSFTSNIDGKQDNTKAGFDTAMGKFSDMAKGMNLPGGAKIDPANIQGSVDSIKKGIMGKLDTMTKDISGTSSAPGANIPNPPKEKQDPKELLKNMPDADIEKLSGDDAKVLLGQLKKLAGMNEAKAPIDPNAAFGTGSAPAGKPADDGFGPAPAAAAAPAKPGMLDRLKNLAGIAKKAVAPGAGAQPAPVAGVKPGAAFGDIGGGAAFGDLPGSKAQFGDLSGSNAQFGDLPPQGGRQTAATDPRVVGKPAAPAKPTVKPGMQKAVAKGAVPDPNVW